MSHTNRKRRAVGISLAPQCFGSATHRTPVCRESVNGAGRHPTGRANRSWGQPLLFGGHVWESLRRMGCGTRMHPPDAAMGNGPHCSGSFGHAFQQRSKQWTHRHHATSQNTQAAPRSVRMPQNTSLHMLHIAQQSRRAQQRTAVGPSGALRAC